MGNIVTIGYSVEGATDARFLNAIIKKTFEDVALQCESEIDVYDPIPIAKPLGKSFNEQIKEVAEKAHKSGINILCVHTDADSDKDENMFSTKINPAFESISRFEEKICNNLVAIVPVQMIEAWMLVDKELLKTEIGTIKSDEDLAINRAPESIADPKDTIKSALRIAQEELPKRRRRIEIGDLYQPLGQKLSIERLQTLPSYAKFRLAVETAFRKLNYLH